MRKLEDIKLKVSKELIGLHFSYEGTRYDIEPNNSHDIELWIDCDEKYNFASIDKLFEYSVKNTKIKDMLLVAEIEYH